MKLRPADKDLITGIVLLALNIFIYVQIADIRWGHEQFLYSAAMLPMSANVLFSVLVFALIAKSVVKGGRIRLGEFGAMVKANSATREFRIVGISMLIILFLVFVAVPMIGFWISGSVFLLSVLLLYVKSFKPLTSIIFTAATMGALYGIFVVVFMVPLR